MDDEELPPASAAQVADGLGLEISEHLVASPQHRQASTHSVDFEGLLSPPLLLHEDPKHGNGGFMWPAGLILAKYLLRCRRRELHQRSMLVFLFFS